MNNQENNKKKLVKEIQQEENQMIDVINSLEKEISILRQSILKKEIILDELNTQLEEVED